MGFCILGLCQLSWKENQKYSVCDVRSTTETNNRSEGARVGERTQGGGQEVEKVIGQVQEQGG